MYSSKIINLAFIFVDRFLLSLQMVFGKSKDRKKLIIERAVVLDKNVKNQSKIDQSVKILSSIIDFRFLIKIDF